MQWGRGSPRLLENFSQKGLGGERQTKLIWPLTSWGSSSFKISTPLNYFHLPTLQWRKNRPTVFRWLAPGCPTGDLSRPDSALHSPASEKVSKEQNAWAEQVRPALLCVLPGNVQEASGTLFWGTILECPSVTHCHLHCAGDTDIYIFKPFLSKLMLTFSGAGSYPVEHLQEQE